MKLNKETRAVLKKELDWLPDLLPEVVGEFKVEVFDLDALNMRPQDNIWNTFRIYLIDLNGMLIGEVGRKYHYHRYSWPIRKLFTLLFGPVKGDGYSYDETFAENLEQAIERLEPASRNTQFVLNVEGYYSTLYKIPRGRSLSVQIEVKKQAEQISLIRFLESN